MAIREQCKQLIDTADERAIESVKCAIVGILQFWQDMEEDIYCTNQLLAAEASDEADDYMDLEDYAAEVGVTLH